MRSAIPLLVLLLSTTPAGAQQPKSGGGRYTICVMPFGCGANGDPAWKDAPNSQTPDPKKAAPVPRQDFYLYPDPLTQESSVKDDITSAVRLSPAQTGAKEPQVVIIRRAGKSVALPATKVPPKTSKAGTEAADEIAAVRGSGKAAGQINAMRERQSGAKKRGELGKPEGAEIFGDSSPKR